MNMLPMEQAVALFLRATRHSSDTYHLCAAASLNISSSSAMLLPRRAYAMCGIACLMNTSQSGIRQQYLPP